MAGVVRDAELPAAVAAAGGHGMFPATFLRAPYLDRAIDDLNARTRAFGVNLVNKSRESSRENFCNGRTNVQRSRYRSSRTMRLMSVRR
jgi:hypothetical protein